MYRMFSWIFLFINNNNNKYNRNFYYNKKEGIVYMGI